MAIVYKHIRLDTNEVFYVGIGKSIKRINSKNWRNQHWHNIVNKHGLLFFESKGFITSTYINMGWSRGRLSNRKNAL